MRTYNDYLLHYGVKGMKWGVRHDPIRTGRNNKKSNKKLSNAQKVLIGAAIVGSAAFAGVMIGESNVLSVGLAVDHGYRFTQMAQKLSTTPLKSLSSDKIIVGKNETLGRVDFGKKTNALNSDHMFANRTAKDTNRYKVMLKQREPGATYSSKFKPKSDLVGDSERGRVTTFMGLMTDKKFRDAFAEDLSKSGYNMPIDTKHTRQYYTAMQSLLGNKDSKAASMYIEKTRQKGFDIIADDNDNGAFAEKATIVLDPKSKVRMVGRQKVGHLEKYFTKIILQ